MAKLRPKGHSEVESRDIYLALFDLEVEIVYDQVYAHFGWSRMTGKSSLLITCKCTLSSAARELKISDACSAISISGAVSNKA